MIKSEKIKALQNDNLSGAGEILAQAGDIYKDFFTRRVETGVQAFKAQLQNLAETITSAHPRMAPLLNLAIHVNQACEKADRVTAKQSAGMEAVNNFLTSFQQAQSLAVKNCLPVLKSGTVCTCSRSSLVQRVLTGAGGVGYDLKVHLLESRPMMEGRTLAKRLSAAGIPVVLFTDAAMGLAVTQSDVVLVGADAYSKEFIINKIGTDALALLAQYHRRPIYAVTTTHKHVPAGVKLPGEPEHDAGEIWPGAPDGVHITNRYFTNVSRRLFTGIITENGVERISSGLAGAC